MGNLCVSGDKHTVESRGNPLSSKGPKGQNMNI